MILQNAIYVCSIPTTMKMIARLGALAGLTLATVAGEGPGPVIQQAYVKSSNAGLNDQFAWSGGGIALAGDTLVAGAPGEDSSAKGVDGDQGDGLDPTPRNPSDGFDAGAAYVFLRYGSGWSQQAYLKSTDTASNDAFGRAVAVSEDTVVVGAVGADGKQDGVPYEGAAYVFVREGNTWRQQARLNVPGNSDNKGFGVSVAICGDTVVVGASNERAAPTAEGEKPGSVEKLMAGAAYVFVRDGGEWRRQARLEASNARYKLHFGTSVAISGNTIIVGAIGDNSAAGGVNGDQSDDSALGAGAAYVFVRDGTKWSQQAYLKAPKPGKFDEFGTAVAIAGETAVVGAVAAKAAKAANGRKSDGQKREEKRWPERQGQRPGRGFRVRARGQRMERTGILDATAVRRRRGVRMFGGDQRGSLGGRGKTDTRPKHQTPGPPRGSLRFHQEGRHLGSRRSAPGSPRETW
jgi:hypothetical protein